MSEARRAPTLAEVSSMYQTLRKINAAIERHGLTVPMLLLIKSVGDHPHAPISRHARVLQWTPSVVSNAIDRIETRGFVRRVRNTAAGGSSDRREVRLELTDDGRALLTTLATIELPPMDDLVIGERS